MTDAERAAEIQTKLQYYSGNFQPRWDEPSFIIEYAIDSKRLRIRRTPKGTLTPGTIPFKDKDSAHWVMTHMLGDLLWLTLEYNKR